MIDNKGFHFAPLLSISFRYLSSRFPLPTLDGILTQLGIDTSSGRTAGLDVSKLETLGINTTEFLPDWMIRKLDNIFENGLYNSTLEHSDDEYMVPSRRRRDAGRNFEEHQAHKYESIEGRQMFTC